MRLADDDGAQLGAAIGPGAGPCCYEVGPEVHARFADYELTRDGDNLDLKAIAATQLQAAGVAAVHDLGMCTICAPTLFFSHRRDAGDHRAPSRAGVVDLIAGLRAEIVRRNLEQVRAEIADAGRDPAEVEILAAIKYLPAAELAALADGGVTVVGENRAQELIAKAGCRR